MIEVLINSALQLVLLLLVAPLLSGTIKTLKARLQMRRGPGRGRDRHPTPFLPMILTAIAGKKIEGSQSAALWVGAFT